MKKRRLAEKLIRGLWAGTLALVLLASLACAPAQAGSKYKKPYYIKVDVTNQIVTVYNTSDDSIARQMICSTGIQDSTPRGTFYLPEPDSGERKSWYFFHEFNCYAQYVTRIIDEVLFHSIPCSYKSQKSVSQKALKKLGRPASHGCIRLLWPDAKFIAEECAAGTRVEIYKSRKENAELRTLLLSESYDGSHAYREYLGLVDDADGAGTVLGLTSKGEAVRDLQYRLRDLGIFGGECNGEYHGDTVNAVRFAKRLMGLDATGTADEAFRQRIFAEDAPVAFNVVLTDGSNGPAVRKLQQRLSDLKIYEGPLDGIYDSEVSDALKRFQAAYGYDIDDNAAVEVQKALAYEAERIRDIFDPMGGCSLDMQEEKAKFGRVDAASGIRMRSKAGTSGDVLATVPDAALVLLLEKGNEWSKIQHGTDVGYVKNEYMHYYAARNCVLTYTSADGYASYRLGCTLSEYQAGKLSQAERIDLDNPDEEAAATVNTGHDDLVLNLRQSPGTDGAVLAALPNGESVRPLLDVGEWTLVDYNGLRGYLMAQYLTRDDGDDGGAVVVRSDVLLQAIVKPRYDDKAQVYDADSDDAVVLGSLKAGLFVSVVESTESGWSHINYQGHEGYMRDEDMVFLNGV